MGVKCPVQEGNRQHDDSGQGFTLTTQYNVLYKCMHARLSIVSISQKNCQNIWWVSAKHLAKPQAASLKFPKHVLDTLIIH